MKDIPVYKAEAEAGLTEVIKANASIAYAAPLTSWSTNESTCASLFTPEMLARASTFSDLYPTNSILVTTNWNKNDDVFGASEVWAARNTPGNKPTNLEHDEHEIVGHMQETWAMDVDGNIIPDNTIASDLPNVYHLCNSAVIYTNWEDEKLIERTNNLIEKIEAGEKYVSMECLFSGFNYAVVASDGSSFVVPRNEDSAFLTKHLCAYGGTGEYQDYKVGRFLKDITFSGKGYVDRPANPESIIFSKASVNFDFASAIQENPFIRNNGVSMSYSPGNSITNSYANDNLWWTRAENNNHNLIGEDDMSSENELLKTQLDDAKAEVREMKAELAALTDKLAKADIAQYETQISDLASQVEAANKVKEEDDSTIASLNTQVEELTTKVDELTESKAEAEAKVAEAEASRVRANRISTLVDGQIDKETAEAKVEKFSNLDEDQFSALAEDLIEAAKITQGNADTDVESTEGSETSEDEQDEEVDDANASDESLEEAEATEEDVDVNSDTETAEASIRDTIAKALEARKKKRGKNSGEEGDN